MRSDFKSALAPHEHTVMKRMTVSLLALGLVLGVTAVRDADRRSPLVVHEWGTITTKHAPDGTPQGRLNRISKSDVLPPFVHRYEPPSTKTDPKRSLTKSPVTPGRPDVTMRLETPGYRKLILRSPRPEQLRAMPSFTTAL